MDEAIDYSQLPLEELKKRGFLRWGRQPIPNLWLMPGTLLSTCLKGTTLYGIDGEKYVVGFSHIDTTLLFTFLAYGVKVDEDTAPGGPEVPPEELAKLAEKSNSKGKERRATLKVMNDRGMFFPT